MRRVLAIESSCDESAAAVVESDGHALLVRSNIIGSQEKLHAQYGGVVPELASREHLALLPLVVKEALQQAGVSINDLHAIAVTRGPGLKGCLMVGVDFARGLSLSTGLPLFGVHHIEGHMLSPWLEHPELKTPWLSLVVSGGHTELAVVRDVGKYELFSRTSDDAAGEAFDKAATLLGLPYPGGARLSNLCASVTETPFKLPIGRKNSREFSFSGFKTAVSLLVKSSLNEETRPQIALAVELGIVSALVEKTERAIKETGIRTVCISGGVAANQRLRRTLGGLSGVTCFTVSPEYCTDNAAMIGGAMLKRFAAGFHDQASVEVLPRWPIEGQV